MKAISSQLLEELISNGSLEKRDKDHYPVDKLFQPGTTCTWLLTELDYEDESIAFGLCDPGQGLPELGYVSIEEIESVRVHGIFKVECDLYFTAKYPISVYAEAARIAGGITEDDEILKRAANG